MSIFMLKIIGGIFLVVSVGCLAHGQSVLIENKTTFLSCDLAGLVMDQSDRPIPGARVQLMSSGWTKMLKETETNINGHFDFNTKRTEIYFLRIHAPGFQRHLFKIRVTRKFKWWPKLTLEVAT